MIDLHHIATRHDEIDRRLREWARWVRVSPKPWATQPMFRWARSNARQWEADPAIRETMNTLDCHEIERAVSFLPTKHRSATRWAYVFPYIHAGKIQRELAVTADALAVLIVNSRDMLANRLQMRLVNVEEL